MSTYAIGDVQGCYQALVRLLDRINFDQGNDRLYFAGDVVNRGTDSLKVLQLLMELGESAVTVLGNHDLHLIATAAGIMAPRASDTFGAILESPEKEDMITWIRQRPLLHHDKDLDFFIMHAGLPPEWEARQAAELATEVAQMLTGTDHVSFLKVMYGNEPNFWQADIKGADRLRFIINCLTRMRYVNSKHELDFSEKGPPGSQQSNLFPWFSIAERKSKKDKVIFGHWSNVRRGNITDFTSYNVYPIDTGYLWGGQLTAMRLEDQRLFSISAGDVSVGK